MALLAACYGFAGGGFPGHVRTVAVLPFENETQVAELTREVNDELRKGLRSRLGLREASEARAHAVVRGKLTRYETKSYVGEQKTLDLDRGAGDDPDAQREREREP